MDRFVCIHGHFYQPPRENPWLESVEVQDSASPYHDWNERITFECYAPNASARMLDGDGRIAAIVNNYSRISFNFGPSLLAWMKERVPEVHEAIVAADKLSQERFSGHGSALAQVYNHMILPLANERDKRTQVRWGIADFESRFGRKPEGMWLAETAADTETLEALAGHGIKFTILSPFQASRFRPAGKRNWRDVNGGRIDPKQPYLLRLPSGKRIAVFFYDAPVSQAVAFEKLLTAGERFAERLAGAFSEGRQGPQLVNIATDGESYGHHHRYGEMALAYALHCIETRNLAQLTNYGEYLEKHPPTDEVQIHQKSAWSCVHGVGRWMHDCGCNSGGQGGWKQSWREPLRHALDWLRDELAPAYEAAGRELFRDPWKARDAYISVILDRSPGNRETYFVEQSGRKLTAEEEVRALKLQELQRHAMLMYTSCGWFFDELSGIETVQVIQYAARALQLAGEVLGQDLESKFVQRLQAARSNIPEHCDGKCIYEKFVKPSMIDWPKAAAHYAISSVFQKYGPQIRLFSYRFEDEDRHLLSAGKTRLAIGRTRMISEITEESEVMSYAILYLGEHNLTGGVRKFESAEEYANVLREIKDSYDNADFPETIRRIDRNFGTSSYSLKSLFRDEQRRILNEILGSTREDLENRFRLITERYGPLMKFLEGAGAPLPTALRAATELVMHADIRKVVTTDPLDLERLGQLMQEALSRESRVLDDRIHYVAKNRMEQMILEIDKNPEELDVIRRLRELAELVRPMPLNLWKVQNAYWRMLQERLPGYRDRNAQGDARAAEWIDAFLALGESLNFGVKHLKDPAIELRAAA
jgi:alpha-amylase/alpha-mannosidase (GH57 family)